MENNALVKKSIIDKVLKTITSQQFTDGSWQSNYSLRIPSTNIKDPDNEVQDWQKSNIGVNAVFKDFHRLFTTSSCISALNKYALGNKDLSKK